MPSPGKRMAPSAGEDAEMTLRRYAASDAVMNRVNYADRSAEDHQENGRRRTSQFSPRGPTIIEGKQGNAELMVKFWESLREKAAIRFAKINTRRFSGGWKHGRVALRNYLQHLPGQLLALIGPAGCGKSLGQSFVTSSLRPTSGSKRIPVRKRVQLEMWAPSICDLATKS